MYLYSYTCTRGTTKLYRYWLIHFFLHCPQQPTTKFVRAIGKSVRTDDSLTVLKNKLLLRPQQKMRKNITIVAQISATAIMAIQTGAVNIGGADIAYSHFLLILKTSVL